LGARLWEFGAADDQLELDPGNDADGGSSSPGAEAMLHNVFARLFDQVGGFHTMSPFSRCQVRSASESAESLAAACLFLAARAWASRNPDIGSGRMRAVMTPLFPDSIHSSRIPVLIPRFRASRAGISGR